MPPTASDTPAAGSFVGSDTSIAPGGRGAPTAGDAPVLSRLKHYRLLELIGRGGMGDVYRAHDEMFNRTVAVKVLPADLADDQQFVRRFQREAKAIAGLSHPNIVPVYGSDHDQGVFFYAMQFIVGESLDQRLRRQGTFPLQDALAIITACLSALEAAHAQGLIHRDVKPGNVLLQEHNDHVFLVDFGLVRRVDGNTSDRTITGMVMGTVDYMAPEQARGAKEIDHRADLYAVGAMLYHLLSGRLPFDAQSFSDKLYCHAYESPLPLAECAPHLPPQVVQLVEHLMAKKPADRPAHCRAVIEAIAPLRAASFRTRHVTEQLHNITETPSEPTGFHNLPESYTPWQRFSDRAASFVQARSPAWLQRCRSLEKQVEGEVARLDRRQRHLQALQQEGQQLLLDLKQQRQEATTHDARLDEQIKELNDQLLRLNFQLADAKAQHIGLVNRRDVLSARLQQVTPRTDNKQVLRAPLAIGSAAALFLMLLFFAAFRGNQESGESPDVPVPPPPPDKIVPSEWVDLLPLIDPARHAISGTWARNADGSLRGQSGQTTSGHARLQIPVYPNGSYELEARISRRNSDVNLLLPIGEHSARASFGFKIEGSLISHVGGERSIGISNAVPAMEQAGPPRLVRVIVHPSPDKSSIQVFVNNVLTCDWTDAGYILANNAPCAIPDARALGLTVSNQEGIYHSLRFRMLSGYADLTPPRRAPAVIDLNRGLVAHYKFDEGQGLYAHDRVGKHDGRLHGAKWAQGFDDGAVYFDPQDTVRVGKGFLGQQANYTITGWALHYGHTDQFHLCTDFTDDRILSSFRMDRRGFTVAAIWTPQVWLTESTEWSVLPARRWSFVAARFSSNSGSHGTMKLWIDGRSWERPSQVLISQSKNARIGYGGGGLIEDLRIYHRAISDTEVEAIYAQQVDKAKAANEKLTPPETQNTPSLDTVGSELAGPIAVLNAKLAANPRSQDLYLKRGNWYAARARWREACIDLERSLEIHPDMWWCRSHLARIYLYLNDHEAYGRHCEFLLTQFNSDKRDDKRPYMLRSLCLDGKRWEQQLAVAEPEAEGIVARFPKDYGLQRVAAQLRYARGRWQESIDAVNMACPQAPTHINDCYPWCLRIMALHRLGKKKEAEEALKAWKKHTESLTIASPRDAGYDKLPLDNRLEWFTFNGLEAQIVYRDASELVFGKREELAVAPAISPESTVAAMLNPTTLPRRYTPVNSVLPAENKDGKQDFALSFDGSAHVELPLWYDGSHPLSIEAFVTPLATDRVNVVIANVQHGGLGIDVLGTPPHWSFPMNDGMSPGLGYQRVPSDAPLQLGKRVHVAIVLHDTQQQLYVDGKLQTTQPQVRGIKPSTMPFFIGADPNKDCRPENLFYGVIDEVRISRSVRYTTDFSPDARFTPDAQTLALYHFDEGSGNRLNDASGNGYHGTIQNAKWVRADATHALMKVRMQSIEDARKFWREGNLKQARAGYEQWMQQSPDSHYQLAELAALCLAMGDDAAYREHCRALVARGPRILDPGDRLHVLRVLCLVPDVDPSLVDRLNVGFSGITPDSEWQQRAFMLCLYRTGQWQQAVELAKAHTHAKSPLQAGRVQCELVSAMTLWKQQDHAAARKRLADAEQLAKQPIVLSPSQWTEVPNRLYAEILYREATKLIDGAKRELTWGMLRPPDIVLPQLAALPGHARSIATVAIAPQQGYAITGDRNGSVHVWEFSQRKHLFKLTRTRSEVSVLGVSPDSRWLAIGTSTGDVELWDLNERQLRERWQQAGGFVRSLEFTPDGKQLYIAGKGIYVWSLGQPASSIRVFATRGVFDLAITKDGQTLISGEYANGQVAVFETSSGKLLYEFPTIQILHRIDLAPDEQTLLVVGGEQLERLEPGAVQIWDWKQKTCVKNFIGHPGFVSDGRFTPDGQHVVSGGLNDCTLRVWHVASEKELARGNAPAHCVSFLAITPDAQQIVTGGGAHFEFGKHEDDGDSHFYFWDLTALKK